jgi:hypothetical protein
VLNKAAHPSEYIGERMHCSVHCWALEGGEEIRVPLDFYPRHSPQHHSFWKQLSGSQIRSGGWGQEYTTYPNRFRFHGGFSSSLVTTPLSNAGSAVRTAVLLCVVHLKIASVSENFYCQMAGWLMKNALWGV